MNGWNDKENTVLNENELRIHDQPVMEKWEIN